MRVAWPEFALLDEAGFGSYEKRALVTLAVHGVSDAATLCRDGDIPTSKIYAAMEKLSRLGLVEVRRSRPQLYAALPPEPLVERLNAIARERADAFADASAGLRAAFEKLPHKLKSSEARVDLALGAESHVKRHVSRLASARQCVRSYMESGDIDAIRSQRDRGFDAMKAIARQREKSGVEHRAIFGFSDRTAPRLLEFLREFAASTRTLSGVRYSGEIGHPFHVVDDDTVILALDHPFVGEGRFASLLVQDRALAGQLIEGFDALWTRALKDLREIRAWPRPQRPAT
ncbi:TrmB family transcriptional regulator [Tahibacter soli]|jgi:sugar-specific transcriptional regulator TrmB|uniref:Helix-turn-helix domain-containing protein n=1 Tax=Tahibacter soli TaxID=2983605 RepID=A0A9X3YN32_9GAMM|nr:helix-turn-helix domain-containing protein [Tahibacter soli]MDC8013696.1 helix-turn-helix domain-containing protein [Tahibacter soli]